MAGPVHGIVGNDYGIDIPETEYTDEQLAEVRKMAKFTRTAEYARQKDWAEAKIQFYQKYLPNGKPVSEAEAKEKAEHWVAANEIIGLLNEFMRSYESSAEEIAEMQK